MAIRIEQFTCRSDNFGVLAHDEASGETLIVDAPELAPILAAIERTGWTPKTLIVTHHHGDHVEANLALKERYGLKIVGPAKEASKIPGIDRAVAEGDTLSLGAGPIRVIDTPGHTLGHISYHLPEAKIAFVADTLFALGCGRLLEGTPEMMLGSLKKLAALEPQTQFYCGHEYTLSNARFALSVDPENAALRKRAAEVEKLRAAGKPTLPATIGEELETNPFLRADDPAIRRLLGMESAPEVEVFAEIRRRKDSF